MQCPQCGFQEFDDSSGCHVCGYSVPVRGATASLSPSDRNLITFPQRSAKNNFLLTRRHSAVPKVDLPLFPAAEPPQDSSEEENSGLLWREELEAKLRQYRARRATTKQRGALKAPEAALEPSLPVVEKSQAAAPEFSSWPDEKFEWPSPTATEKTATPASPGFVPPSVQRIKQQRRASRRPDLFQQSLLFEAPPLPWTFLPEMDRVALPIPPASPRARFAAAGLDLLFIAAIELLFIGLVFALARFTQTPLHLAPRSLAVGFAGGLLFLLGYHFFFTTLGRETLGMRHLELTLVNFAGASPSLKESALRTLGYVVSGGSLLLGFLWVYFDDDALAWHDRISRTYPVESRHLNLDS